MSRCVNKLKKNNIPVRIKIEKNNPETKLCPIKALKGFFKATL